MALRVWLPLNGNLKNNGISSLKEMTLSNATYPEGKIGPCIKVNKVPTDKYTVNEMYNSPTFTIACWLRINSAEIGSAYSDFFTVGVKSDDYQGDFRIEHTAESSPGSFQIVFPKSTSYSGTNNYYTVYSSTEVARDKWCHITITVDINNVNIYINGQLIKTLKTNLFCGSSINLDNSIRLGGSTAGNTGVCYLNDLRVYDNCLTEYEVQELAKGLVAHYKLSVPSMGNLFAGSYNFLGWNIASGWTTGIAEDGSTYISFTRTGATSNNWIRAIPSLKINPDDYPSGVIVSFDFKCDDLSAWNHKCVASLQTYTATGTRVGWHEPNDINRLICNGALKSGEWKRVSIHFTQSQLKAVDASTKLSVDDISYTMFSFQLVQNGTIYLKKISCYPGNNKFSWMPNVDDNQYVEYNFKQSLLNDCSGNGYNLIYGPKLPAFDGNSIRQDGSCKFQEDASQYLYRDDFKFLNKSLTFSAWVYQTKATTTSSGNSTTTRQYIVSQGRDYTGGTTGDYGCSLVSFNGVLGFEIGTIFELLTGVTELNKWHMITGTWDGATAKVYLDGVLKKSSAMSTVVYTQNEGKIVIGKMAHGYTGTTSYFPFVGNINDVRIYSTALSDNDVKKLYEASAYIQDNKIFYGYEFIED